MELVENGGFEATDLRAPVLDPWTVKNGVGDKSKCNKDKDGDGVPDKFFSHTGECAFRFKGGAGENSKLTQIIDISGVMFSSGDTLDLLAYIDAGSAATGKVKVS
jgi:hypothetical protein